MICPSCNKDLDVHIHVGYDNVPPVPGDVIFCARCHIPLILNKDQTLRIMSEVEIALLSDEERADLDFALRLPKLK
jgi:hypothetical protein